MRTTVVAGAGWGPSAPTRAPVAYACAVLLLRALAAFLLQPVQADALERRVQIGLDPRGGAAVASSRLGRQPLRDRRVARQRRVELDREHRQPGAAGGDLRVAAVLP